MSEAVLVALISGGLTFAGVLVTKSSGDKNNYISEFKIEEI